MSTRYTISGKGLETPKTYPVEVGCWYYLGASGSPDLIKVITANAERFTYQTYTALAHNETKVSTIERWIGEDLIARGSATMRKSAAHFATFDQDLIGYGYSQYITYILDHHDLDEEHKQDLDLEQAEHEVINTREAEDRRRMFGYEVEDAIREYQRLHRADTDYWTVEDRNVYPGDTVNYTDHPGAVPYTCADCGNEIHVNINHGPDGLTWCDPCFNARQDRINHTCANCGREFQPAALNWRNGKMWCDACFSLVVQVGEPGRIPMGTRVCVRGKEYGIIDGQWTQDRYDVLLDSHMRVSAFEREITVTPSSLRKFATPDIHTVKPGDQVAFVDGPGYTPALPAEQGIAYGVKRSIWGDQLKVKITDDSGNVRFEYVLHFVSVGIGAYYIGQNRYK